MIYCVRGSCPGPLDECGFLQVISLSKSGAKVQLFSDSTLGHDSFIKDFVSIMPTVNISGEVTIGECVNVGAAATIINRLEIGEYSIVGAGAVLTKTLPAHCTAVGVPAKIIKFHQVKKVSIGELQ